MYIVRIFVTQILISYRYIVIKYQLNNHFLAAARLLKASIQNSENQQLTQRSVHLLSCLPKYTDGATQMYDDQNVFAKILRGELPCHHVYEDDHTLAFMDIMPQVAGHTLVIPKYPAETLFDLPTELAGHLLATVQKVGQAVKIAMQHEGIVIMQLNDQSAGQTVFHLHFHIMPTSLGALGRQAHAQTIGDQAVIAQAAEKIKAVLATL